MYVLYSALRGFLLGFSDFLLSPKSISFEKKKQWRDIDNRDIDDKLEMSCFTGPQPKGKERTLSEGKHPSQCSAASVCCSCEQRNGIRAEI